MLAPALTMPASVGTSFKDTMTRKTSFQRVAEMNTAFGNPRGYYRNVNFDGLMSQCENILDEYNELMDAIVARDKDKIRDALCDIQVFAMGAQHKLGVNGDEDMDDVVDGVMTRFVKDEADLLATQAKHFANGIVHVYIEGEYPKMVLKSSCDQPDAPKGKFLKSASYKDTVFRDPMRDVLDLADGMPDHIVVNVLPSQATAAACARVFER